MAAMLNLHYAVANKCVGFPARKGGHAHSRSAAALQLRKLRLGSDASACCMKKHLSSYGGSWPSYAVAMDGKNPRAGSAPSNEPEGIRITEFLGGKNFFITGGTRFLAKVIIEKILRTTPDVGKIYVLIKEKDSEAALKRARLHGWQDTYVFTKAMGEMVLDSMRGEIPVVTIRPSIIEGTWSEPIPGWIEGIRMIDPIILYYGKGRLSGFPADGDGVADVVPADMVVNAILSAVAKHAQALGAAREMHIYHVGSSPANPLMWRDMFRFFFQHFTRYPFSLAAGQPIKVAPMRLFGSMQQFNSNVERDVLLWVAGETLSPRARMLFTKYAEKISHLARMYQPYGFYGCRFDNANTEALFGEMSVEEKTQFHFDVRSIEWKEYFTNVHIPGFLKHVMKGRGTSSIVGK